jgi:hypothetical protein
VLVTFNQATILNSISTRESAVLETFPVRTSVIPVKWCLQEAADDGIISRNLSARVREYDWLIST